MTFFLLLFYVCSNGASVGSNFWLADYSNKQAAYNDSNGNGSSENLLVWLCACVGVLRACMCVCVHACVCMRACTRVCVHVCVRACVHARVHVCVCACVHACVLACVCVYVRACVHTCVCARVCV